MNNWKNNIKKYILLSGLKNTFIAKKIGCHHTDISAWIGGYKKPNALRLKMLAQILKCNQIDLYPTLKFRRTPELKEKENRNAN
jgi:hypothetical protein